MIVDKRNRALLEKALDALPEWHSQDDTITPASTPAVKVFMADGGGRWFLTEKDTSDENDVRFFGLCDLSMGFPELGWVGRRELFDLSGVLGLGVEFDEHTEEVTLAYGYEYVGAEVPSWMPA